MPNKKTYPRWKFHPNLGAKIVYSEAEERALVFGWSESSSVIQDPKVKAKVKAAQKNLAAASRVAEEPAKQKEQEPEPKESSKVIALTALTDQELYQIAKHKGLPVHHRMKRDKLLSLLSFDQGSGNA